MQKTEFIVVIGIVQSYLVNEERDWISATILPKLQEKVPCVRGETKLNFGNEIIEILVLPCTAKLACEVPKMYARGSARNGNQLW